MSGGRHSIDPTSLVFGIIFGGIAVGALLVSGGLVDLADVRLALPGLLITAGLVGIVVSVGRHRG